MCSTSCFSTVGSMRKLPCSKMVLPPRAMRTPARLTSGAWMPTCLPIAMMMRPTLGSLPAKAHFTSGALMTALPSARASPSEGAPHTVVRTTWRTPSPLRTTSSARSAHTVASACAKAASSLQGTAPEESNTTVSEVLVSVSMLMQLKLGPTAKGSKRRRLAARAEGGGPFQRHPRIHRYGQLPGREAGHPEAGPARRERRRGASAGFGWWPEARGGAGPPVEHHQELQRSVWYHVRGCGSDRPPHSDRHRPQGGRRFCLPQRQAKHATDRAHRARQGACEGDADDPQGRNRAV